MTIKITDGAETGKTRATKLKYTLNGTENTITNGGTFNITTDGTQTIIAWAEDENGNKSETTIHPQFTRDATAPKPTIGTPTTN